MEIPESKHGTEVSVAAKGGWTGQVGEGCAWIDVRGSGMKSHRIIIALISLAGAWHPMGGSALFSSSVITSRV